MSDDTPVTETFQTIAARIEALGRSVDSRFAEVDEALVEQREYTEFAFETLRSEMNSRFAEVNSRFAEVDSRFDRIDRKLDRLIEALPAPSRRRRRT